MPCGASAGRRRLDGASARFRNARPGGFAIAALMRPPAGGRERGALARARAEAQPRGPLGLHTHWAATDHARPTGGDPAALVREQGRRLDSLGLGPTLLLRRRLVHGRGSWPRSPSSATPTARRPRSVPPTCGRRRRGCSSTSRSGSSSVRAAAVCSRCRRRIRSGCLRAAARPFRRPIVHAYFHDTDLLDHGRAAALRVGLSFLGLKRTVTDLDELQRGLRPEKTMSFANSVREAARAVPR